MKSTALLSLLPLLYASAAMAGTIDAPVVTRSAPDRLTIAWHDSDPVDVFQSDSPDARPAAMKPVAKANREGQASVSVAPGERPYFLLKDSKSGKTVHVAERLLPLEQGSNFRDIGGYPAAGGRHVRWGMIYRSGGQPLLNASDLSQIHALGLTHIVDLRSSEERVLAPTRIEGVPYQAIGYSMSSLLKGTAPSNGEGVYRTMPTMLAPHLKMVFADLLNKDGGIAYNCSAGQDRTGFVTAMILSALGVPRDVILTDYHLSTEYRRPEWEMPKIDPAAHAGDPVAHIQAVFMKIASTARL